MAITLDLPGTDGLVIRNPLLTLVLDELITQFLSDCLDNEGIGLEAIDRFLEILR